MSASFQPVIIIGAARSGTNMLRDILTSIEGFGTWDCDEINPIWRHGNLRNPSDVFTSEMARPQVAEFIQAAFARIAKAKNLRFVVEKSCANSLRIPFIDRVLPEARYIFIVRDGRDTVVSSEERWKAPFDFAYTMRKLRYVPTSDLPVYAFRFGVNRLRQLVAKEGRLSFWGVQLENMQRLLEQYDLQEVCALQWKHCVEKAENDLHALAASRFHLVIYERFVEQPSGGLAEILEFLGVGSDGLDLDRLVSGVRAGSVGRYRAKLSADVIEKIERMTRETLSRFGYL